MCLWLQPASLVSDTDSLHPVSLLERDPPAASGTGGDAAPAFVQLGVVVADVIPYIP